MRPLALVVAILLLAVGTVCAVFPGAMLAAAPYLLTTVGLYSIGALRLGMGVVILWAAGASRYPTVLRALGVLFIVAGVATPIFGVDRARGMMELGAAQGSLLIRAAGVLIFAVGSFIAHAVTPARA
ncbi:MAG: hypothetical protein Q8K55_08305 [Gemmatimonadaceae bacterium]|nr:hypothetical protein [Gemmatimonadaceae bacterium]